MRNIFLLLLLLVSVEAISQTADTLGYARALRLSEVLGDSLDLRTGQKDTLYEIHMELFREQYNVRQQYSDMDTLRVYLQRVESKRDILYRPVLGEEKYALYKSKKVVLLTTP